MTVDEIATLVRAAGSILDVLRHADGRDKAAVYRQLGLRLTYEPDPRQVFAEARPSAIMYETECPRIDTDRNPTRAMVVRHHPAVLTSCSQGFGSASFRSQHAAETFGGSSPGAPWSVG
jgi:hypothetical protein